jgi:GDP-fucose protein O-fucosyltransferase
MMKLVHLLVAGTIVSASLNVMFLFKIMSHSERNDIPANDRHISTGIGSSNDTIFKNKPDRQVKEHHRVAGLKCDKYGGPSNEAAAEMVYWQDIPSDAQFVSPYAKYGKAPKYLTFEPDQGAWNNIRMSMETATVLAQAMGRILVLPPEQDSKLLEQRRRNQKSKFTLDDFFHFDSIADEHAALEVISMEEFMRREALTGNLVNKFTGDVEYPPGNATVWNGHHSKGRKYWSWLRNVTATPIWSFRQCVVGVASEPGPVGMQRIEAIRATIPNDAKPWMDEYTDNPTEVDATPEARLREMLGIRRQMCVYDDSFQNQKVIHMMGDNDSGARMLVHFYAFLFFEDYHHDLWTKRFVRDHLRYSDEMQCAAARVIEALRRKAIENGDPNGYFDSFHVRRGDFQYDQTRISATAIYKNTKDVLVPNSTIFIATDENDSSFFDPLRKHYHLLFLHDFKHLIAGLNPNYVGMVDQLIASRGRTFVGAYYSTFTGKWSCD